MAVVQILVRGKGEESDRALKDTASGLQGVGKAAQSAGGHFSAFGEIAIGALRQIGAMAVNVAAAGIQKLVSGMGGLISSGVQMNASMEQTRTAFTTLLGGAEQANSMLGELQKFAASTPFEFPELADSTRRLLAFGFAANDILPMMRSIGDAVGALGGGAPEINRVVMALGQMQAKGKVSAEEMQQLAELGIPAWDMLAKSFGVSTAEVMKLSEKGLIPAKEAIAALTAGMDQMFGGSMQAQSNTFNGLLSTLKDNANQALMAFTGGIFESAKAGLVELGNIVSSPAFQQFAKTLGDQVGVAMTQLATWAIPMLRDAWTLLQGVMQWFIGTGIPAIRNAWNSIVPTAMAFIDRIMNVVDAFRDAGALSSEFAEALGYLATGFGLSQGAAQQFGDFAVGVFTFLKGIFDWFVNIGIPMFLGGIKMLIPGGAQLGTSIQELADNAFFELQVLWQWFLNVGVPAIQSGWAFLVPLIQQLAGTVWDLAQKGFALLQEGWEWFIGTGIPAIKAGMEVVQTAVSQALASILAFWQAHGTEIIAAATTAWEAIKTTITIVANLIQGIIQTATMIIKGDWSGAMTFVRNATSEATTAILRSIGELGPQVIPRIADMTNRIGMLFIGFNVKALEFGSNIIAGILQGLWNGAGSLFSGISNILRQAFEAGKNAIGAHSPSELFAGLGFSMPTGMVKGIQAGLPMMQSAGIAMGQVAAGATVQGATTNNTFNYSPSYGSTPPNPSQDFHLMQVLATAGG